MSTKYGQKLIKILQPFYNYFIKKLLICACYGLFSSFVMHEKYALSYQTVHSFSNRTYLLTYLLHGAESFLRS